uniref:Cytochrome c domain-containing protein n=1 Tax=uncultured verrucomicrobium HF0500_16O23 TaxID=723598 RepID=E7C590_9BACT|nr:hypothetical protein [uncultured verrucomicrobium HF0500_16O23]
MTTREGMLKELKSGERAIVPGKPGQSELLRRLTSNDPDELMPPPNEDKKLSAEQQTLLRQWISAGAEWSIHWAYRPLNKTEPPKLKDARWIRNPIDQFVLAQLETTGVAPSPKANRHTLIRRLYYDLLGLPPTPKEVDAFVIDRSPDAYEKLVDHMLASPHFGERWGRHWLDKARYADSDGYEKDKPRPNAWRYRDWVINAINADMPFDQFTTEQLAGDLLPGATDMQKLATAFNRQTLTNTEGGTDKEQWRVAAIMDRVETLGSVWLGLTVTCARCHNHKYDQLTQKDYYQFFAYFNNGDETSASVTRSKKDYDTWFQTKVMHDAHIKEIQAKADARDVVLEGQLPQLEKRLRTQIDAQNTTPEEFHTLEMTSVKGPKGVNFKKQPDGSLLVTGANPAKAKYTIEFKTDLKRITGLKIEVLPNKALKTDGPGRTPHGNFVLNDIRVYATDQAKYDSKKHRMALNSARADYSQKDWPAKNAIDGKIGEKTKGTGWAVAPQYGRPHHLIVTIAKPISFENRTQLQVVLDQQYGSQHTIGRFRIKARTGQSPNDGIPATIVKILEVKPDKRDKKQNDTLLAHFRAQDAEAKKLQAELKKSAPKPPVMSVRVISQRTNGPRPTHVLHRGEFKQPKNKVAASTPTTLPRVKNRAQGDRLDLAHWLVDGQNPLVPRVTVNHIWANLFGEGIVRTINDFGVRGEAPTHPELLNWLGGEFIHQKWSRKAIIKLIVTSATYRQASVHRPELSKRDPNNMLLHRQNRFRVEAEIIRDLNLAASGLLASKVGGPSVFPPLPSGVAVLSYANNFKWAASKNEDRYRRGLYTFFKRTSPHPNLITFDCPDSNVTCVKRSRSNTPLAALTTLNNEVYAEAAKALAHRLLKEKSTDSERITYGFKISVAREPSANERAALSNLLKQSRIYYSTHETEAKALNGDAEASAWAATARVLLNLDEFITRE